MKKQLQKAMTKSQYLQILGAELERNDYGPGQKLVLLKMHAAVAGWLDKKKSRRSRKKPEAAPAQTMDEMILQLEKESKNGQQHSERQGRAGQEDESRASDARIERS
jgi:hypothetical protein